MLIIFLYRYFKGGDFIGKKNKKGGYVGKSRSKRSAAAIDNYIVPVSMINKALINDFLDYLESNIGKPWRRKGLKNIKITKNHIDYLRKCKISLWKAVAKTLKPTEWHHTSRYYNKTNHYYLKEVASVLVQGNYPKDILTKDKDVLCSYGVAKIQEWGGTVDNPIRLGLNFYAGIIKGDWIHCFKIGDDKLYRFKLSANRTKYFKSFNSYSNLINMYPQFEGKEQQFLYIAKIKNLQIKKAD